MQLCYGTLAHSASLLGMRTLSHNERLFYMNLTSEPMTISISDNLDIHTSVVTDMRDKEVMRITKAINKNVVLDCSALPKGIYELRIGISGKTFIKQ
jgi:hypothetical protein